MLCAFGMRLPIVVVVQNRQNKLCAAVNVVELWQTATISYANVFAYFVCRYLHHTHTNIRSLAML